MGYTNNGLTMPELQGITNNGYSIDQAMALSNPEFAAYAGAKGLDLNALSGQNLDSTIAGFNSVGATGAAGAGVASSINPAYADYLKSQSTQGMIGAGLGIGQLGLGVMSYLDNQKTADAQRKLLGQQYANNAEEMRHTKASRTAMSQGLGQYNPASAPKLS